MACCVTMHPLKRLEHLDATDCLDAVAVLVYRASRDAVAGADVRDDSRYADHGAHRAAPTGLQDRAIGLVMGCLLLAGSGLVAQWDHSVAAFHAALILLGLGWNFTFLPATGLLTESYRPAEKARVQAANEFLVFSTVALSSFAAGPLVSLLGWQNVNLLLIPLAMIPVVLLALQRRYWRTEAR
jgi:MFS family permease